MDDPDPDAEAAQRDLLERAAQLQVAYRARRRDWAQAVGRPYDRDEDPRPPPGELDAEPDE